MGNLESDEIFISELKKGYSYQQVVNNYFQSLGINSNLEDLKIREDRSKIDENSDDGDIIIKVKKRNDIIVEVKSRSLEFTSIEDFPYDTIVVDRVNTWKRKEKNKKTPHAVIVISQITNKMIVIPVSSDYSWFIEYKYDPYRDYTRDYYMCRKPYLKNIEEFTNWLNKFK